MKEVVVLVPTADNAGAAYTPEQFDGLHAFLGATYPAWTCVAVSAAFGFWVDPATATQYRDTHRLYVVAVPHLLDGSVVPLADYIKGAFAQEAVYFHHAAGSDIL